MNGLAPLIGAIALILLGGLFSAIDAAISTVSTARVNELVRDERPGAVRLGQVVRERPRYINLVVLLRIACEATATVLMVNFLDDRMSINRALVVAATIMQPPFAGRHREPSAGRPPPRRASRAGSSRPSRGCRRTAPP